MISNRLILLYLMMLTFHVAHVFEEILGRFWIMNAVHSMGWFMLLNWFLFCLPAIFFFYILKAKRWAFYMGLVYSIVMILNGLVHNIATLVTGKYYDGFAGGFTGIALIIIGIPLAVTFVQELKIKRV
jgi:hypothetical protein